ncbi:hypothetical protein PVA45_07140 (plasmid) [Entomospira entomophila]|uniref:Tail fiber protein n=1 Tax=Entomospira entomophila TaxID=2719988 RepID=A0A968GA76_9SPIO|nr:hypothetical protein [Entomospira entomophilus]NIZ41367.1 hypothetical protein [Entomospira entomophilus]WDI36222.1 hypothetical protein PVA45_07140 [Entomospira entomophilus]
MALIQMQNFMEDDLNQTNSVEMMASWQMWLASSAPFVRLDSGSNSLMLHQGAFLTMESPFRWYRIVEESIVVNQGNIDVGGNFKSNVTYQVFLVDDGASGRLTITESPLAPVGVNENQALWIAQFSTKENGIIDGASLVDSQSSKLGESLPIGKIYVQYPSERSPQDLFPRQQWLNVSADFAGDFLRVEGGNASAFESGQQEQSVPNIEGGWDMSVYTTGVGIIAASTGAFTVNSRIQSSWSGINHTNDKKGHMPVSFNASKSHPAYGRRDEVAPQNQSIRLWKRIG